MSRFAACSLAMLFFTAAAPAQLSDALLDRLVGQWQLDGSVLGKPAHQRVTGSWVLGHQFILLRFTGSYEADVYIGYDAAGKQYVAHWLDTTGGSGADAVGLGTRSANAIEFHFAYPGQPFRTTFTYDAQLRQWRIAYRYQDKNGAWKPFGDETLRS